jgi:hypothetical protein
VVGDHGTYAGQHGLIGEASGTWEPGVRVPLLYLDTQDDTRPDLSGPLSAVVAYDLVARGRLPDPLPPVISVSRAFKPDAGLGESMVSAWDVDRGKLTWRDGAMQLYDLEDDPHEASPRPARSHPDLQQVRAVAERLQSPPEDD